MERSATIRTVIDPAAPWPRKAKMVHFFAVLADLIDEAARGASHPATIDAADDPSDHGADVP